MRGNTIEIIENSSLCAPDCSSPVHFGVHKSGDYYVFMVPVPDKAVCELLLFRAGEEEPETVIPLQEESSLGIVRSVTVKIPKHIRMEYIYRVNGKIKPDPYAKAMSAAGHCVLEPAAHAKEEQLHIPYSDLILYKAHVRGLTMGSGSGVRHRGTFTGIKEKIPYLKELGINGLLLMPVYEFNQKTNIRKPNTDGKTKDDILAGITLPADAVKPIADITHPADALKPIADITCINTAKSTGGSMIGNTGIPAVSVCPESAETTSEEPEMQKNYWGYVEGQYFVPKESYCATAYSAREFAEMVDALHRAGIELHLEFYFPQDCLPRFAANVLQYWKMNYKIDGFHLFGHGPWISAVLADPLLKKTKLFYEGYSSEMLDQSDVTYWGSHEVPASCFGVKTHKNASERNLVEYNRAYTDHMRRFLKGDDLCAEGAAWFMRRNYSPVPSVNYFADQDGFTMNDMVTYNAKYNLANGQNNQDGSMDNHSWNCGVEGPSSRKAVSRLRMQQLKNAFLILLSSQGIPLIYAGDEVMNSQQGNNNAWCQDNETGWVNWKKRKDVLELQDFVKKAIAFRKAHPVLHQNHPIYCTDKFGKGYPDLSYHGEKAWVSNFAPDSHSLGQMYFGDYASDVTIYIACNMHWETKRFALPALPAGQRWMICADTGANGFLPEGEELPVADDEEGKGKTVPVPPRTVMVLFGK